jgi:cytochrome c5
MSKLPALILAMASAACIVSATMAQASTTSGPAALAAGSGEQPVAAQPNDAAARTTFEINCSGCHEITEVTSRRKDLAGWTETVQKMVDYGAPVGSQDQALIIRYLVNTYPDTSL